MLVFTQLTIAKNAQMNINEGSFENLKLTFFFFNNSLKVENFIQKRLAKL